MWAYAFVKQCPIRPLLAYGNAATSEHVFAMNCLAIDAAARALHVNATRNMHGFCFPSAAKLSVCAICSL